MTSEERAQKFHLMTCHCLGLDSASDWLRQISVMARPIRSPTQIWVVTRHQYGISALVPQTSFRGESSGGIDKFRANFGCFLRLKKFINRKKVKWRHIHCPVLRLEFRIKLEFVTVPFKSKLTLHSRSSHEERMESRIENLFSIIARYPSPVKLTNPECAMLSFVIFA